MSRRRRKPTGRRAGPWAGPVFVFPNGREYFEQLHVQAAYTPRQRAAVIRGGERKTPHRARNGEPRGPGGAPPLLRRERCLPASPWRDAAGT